MDIAFEAKLRQIVAKQEITELLYERGRAIDRHDIEGQLRAFTPDATTTHEGWQGPMREFLATRSGTAPGRKRVQIMDHFIANVLVFLDDDRHARAHSYHLCTYTTPSGGDAPVSDRIVVGRYFDWLLHTPDGWRISHRDTVFDWSASLPASERMWAASVGMQHMLVGTSDSSDPVYSHFTTRGVVSDQS